MAVNTLNIVICAYCWYASSSPSPASELRPYIYAMGGWVICFGSRSSPVCCCTSLTRWPQRSAHQLASGLLSSFPPKWFSCSSCTPSAENRLRKPIAWRPRTSESCARPKPMRPSRRRRWPKLSKRCRASYSTPRDARPLPSKQPPEALKAAEARQCIRCNEECAAIREQLFQIDPASAPPRFHALAFPSATMPSPLGSSPSSALGVFLAPSPSTMGELSDSMRRNVERMGEHFLLTSREMDVLTLYALGHTQKKVAEELFITPATAHSHIKRIYSKCGMHSRQEILEYLNFTEARTPSWKRSNVTCAGSAFSASSWPPSASACVFAIGYKDPSVGRVATLAGLIVASAGFFWLAHRKRK